MIDASKIITAEQKQVDAEKQSKDARIIQLQKLLRETDYVALPDYDKDKPEVLAQRQAWRDEIRELEA